jgi:hypothetical protein
MCVKDYTLEQFQWWVCKRRKELHPRPNRKLLNLNKNNQ